MLTYILHDSQARFASICAYSLKYHAPTTPIKLIDISTLNLLPEKQKFAPLLLARSHNDWFLCCYASILFLDSVQDLLDYTHPHKAALKVARFELFDSPIQLWNGEQGIQLDVETINQTNDDELLNIMLSKGIGEIPNTWVNSPDCACPHAILFADAIAEGKYTDIWLGYYEASLECSKN